MKHSTYSPHSVAAETTLDSADELSAEADPIPASHLAELNRRLLDLERHPEKALKPDEARRLLRRLTGF